MRYIGKSKISKINPKPNISYPLIRLPQAFNDFIGKTTNVFETENEGKQAFLVVLDKNSEAEQASSQVMQLLCNWRPWVHDKIQKIALKLDYLHLKMELKKFNSPSFKIRIYLSLKTKMK